mmetsp:Transcript_1388/g.3087  ORF Transcript_1388/g.3087 Transcript_1388/m.3087 type:complete len:204 (-) Transcript_1388:86-697(-)
MMVIKATAGMTADFALPKAAIPEGKDKTPTPTMALTRLKVCSGMVADPPVMAGNSLEVLVTMGGARIRADVLSAAASACCPFNMDKIPSPAAAVNRPIRPPVVAPAPLLLSSCRWKAGAFCICRFGGGRAALTKADSRNCRCSSGDILRPPRRLLFCKSSRAAAPSSMSAMTEAELGQDVENRSILSPDGNRSRITSRGMTDR